MTLPIRIDEPYTMMTTGHGPVFAVEKSISFELQPPAYFFFESIWRGLDKSVFWARMFSVIFYPFIVYYSFVLCRLYVPKHNPLIFSSFVAFNPFLISLTSYARSYSMLLFLSSVLLVLFYKSYLTDKPKNITRLLFIVVSVIGLYTQYYFGFLLFGAGISLLLIKGKNSFKSYVVDMIFPALSLIVLYPFMPAQINNLSGHVNTYTSFPEYLVTIYKRIELYLLPLYDHRFSPFVQQSLRITALFIFIYSAYRIFRNKLRLEKTQIILGILTLVTSLLFIALLYWFGISYVEPKHTIILLVPMLLLFFVFVKMTGNKKLVSLWYVMIFGTFFVMMFRNYLAYKEQPLIKAVEYIKSNESGNEPIFLYSYKLQKFFPYFYKGNNKVIGLPKDIDINKPYDVSQWAYRGMSDIQNNWERYNHLKKFWLVTDKAGSNIIMGVNFHYNLLNDYIDNKFDVLEMKKFGNFEVKELLYPDSLKNTPVSEPEKNK